ncbi:GDSL esterase/lipase At4g16230 [Ziziphus jujuba]|uniref:GDSL esterase/lipase At4g16230 n=1 Tax=Ziziphus jujuba TaxID=326968 RepID=A0ABM3IWS5_ZIZJJ|nr:GDSL esterase/lipase At4g16230 [Ziziphus jujuba]
MARKWIPHHEVLLLAMVILLPLAQATAPAIFIFGDSTADVGTNSFLPNSKARANFPPNGIDFPHSRPTGRFSNGLNSADFLAKLFGYKRSPPPFLALNSTTLKRRSFTGVNFASGGSGLLDITGQSTLTLMKFGKEKIPIDSLSSKSQKHVIPFGEQIQQFSTVREILVDAMGSKAAKKFLSKSLFFISTGSNDIFGYYYSKSSVSKEEFLGSLGATYENHLRGLLNLGARKFGVIGIPPLGCCPSQRVFNITSGCLEELNDLARAFHPILDAILWKLSSKYEGMNYSLGNSYEMTINVIDHPLQFNFKDEKSACCGAGKLNGEAFCSSEANLCLNRNEFLFWDLFHPTQAASKLAALTLYGGPPRFVAPINFSQLADAC